MSDSSIQLRPGRNKNFQYRLLIFVIIVISTFFILILRIGYIQIVKNVSYSVKSTKIREKPIRIPPIRGNILSSDNKLLAHNLMSFNIYISPYFCIGLKSPFNPRIPFLLVKVAKPPFRGFLCMFLQFHEKILQ